MSKQKSMLERFEEKITPEPNTGCHLWTGSIDGYGYGRFSIRRKWKKAHRLAWKLYRGAIPNDMCVCHRCDTRSCVNLDHLFLGTSQENTADMVEKERAQRGETHSLAKLTEAQVLEIYSDTRDEKAIAEAYGVSCHQIVLLKKGKSWTWLFRKQHPDMTVPVSKPRQVANSKRTHCPLGHPYSCENLGTWGRQRYCKECKRLAGIRKEARKRAKRESSNSQGTAA